MMARKGKKFVQSLLIISGCVLFLFLLMQPWTILKFQDRIAILFPKGIVGWEELHLLLFIQALMLLVIIPVFILTFIFSWKYRANNPKGRYDPDLIDHKIAEVIWWTIPFILTVIIGIVTWIKTEQLDPFKPIDSNKKPVTIQVLALQWKWLFLYPEEKIASINFLQVPVDVPIHFEITADAPMNSFWIPHLGGQIYAMPGMKTELNLIANEEGNFRGSSANFSGEGFSGMHFILKATTEEEYRRWIEVTQQSSHTLDDNEYEKLAKPSKNHLEEFYQLKSTNLFNQILMK